jgi:hypothetical protein
LAFLDDPTEGLDSPSLQPRHDVKIFDPTKYPEILRGSRKVLPGLGALDDNVRILEDTEVGSYLQL